MKLLVLSHVPPNLTAANGGARVSAGLVSRLASSHRVALLTLRAPDEEPIDAELAQACELVVEVERVPARSSPTRAWRERQRVPMTLRGAPGWAVAVSVRALGAELERIASTWKPDLVQIEFIVMGQYIRRLHASVPVVLVDHDVTDGDGSWRERKAMRRFRARTLRDADAVVAHTERDCLTLASLAPSASVRRIPIAVELPPAALDPLGSGTDVLFAGNYIHPPNVDAAIRLAQRIFPRVVSRHPDARLLLVGPNPSDDLRALARENVAVTGPVDDLRPYLEGASVVVAPLTQGGGMRVKVLEAIAAGKALVASGLAVEGIDVDAGEHVLVAEDDDAFAEAVAALLGDEQRRTALGGAARRWAESNLDWDRVAEAYEALYASVLERRGPIASAG
jgi:glycosyltransferase involved in cell wall biosynthesis